MLDETLGHHGLGHLHESGHVGTLHIVDAVRMPNPVPRNKELLIIPDASHCDLYDGGYTELEGKGMAKNRIPWDKIEEFIRLNLDKTIGQ